MLRRTGIIGFILAALAPPAPCVPTTVRVSPDPGPTPNAASAAPSISADGRFVAFVSTASDIVPDDVNGRTDVFVRDMVGGGTTCASVGPDGKSAGGAGASISGDGRYVAFVSSASLVAADTNSVGDIYIRDMLLNSTVRAPRPANAFGSSDPAISADGRRVAFVTYGQVYVADLDTGRVLHASDSISGAPANGDCDAPALSGDGRYVAFHSSASDLVIGDANDFTDVFVRDLKTGATVIASVSTSGPQANQASYYPSISADGRLVAFESSATNLGGKPSGTWSLIYVRDLTPRSTRLVSVSPDGKPADSDCENARLSADGRTVAYRTNAANLAPGDTNGKTDVYITNLISGLTSRVSVDERGSLPNGNSGSSGLSVNGDGSAVTYTTAATNVIPGDENALTDVVVSRPSAPPSPVSVRLPAGHAYRPSVSGDGRRVAWEQAVTASQPLWDSWLRDFAAGTVAQVWKSPKYMGTLDGNCLEPCVTGPADTVSYTTNSRVLGGKSAVYRVLYNNGYNHAVASEQGEAGWPSLAGDGSIAWQSDSTSVVGGDTNRVSDIFAKLGNALPIRVSLSDRGLQVNGPSYEPAFSYDATTVAFTSYATDVVPGDTNGQPDVFVRNVVTRKTLLVSLAWDGSPANGPSGPGGVSVSGNGRYVAFVSHATNLVPDDVNRAADVFVRDTVAGVTIRASVAPDGTDANGPSERPSISADGRYVAFRSIASNLVPGDANWWADIFVRDLVAGVTIRVSVAADGAEANGDNAWPAISADGRYVAFESFANNLAPGDTNGVRDIYLHGPLDVTPGPVSVRFAVNPMGTTPFYPLTPQPAVEAVDYGGVRVVDFRGPVTLSLQASPAGAILGGTLTVNAVDGLATFTDATVSLGGEGYVLRASSPNLKSGDSAAFGIASRVRWSLPPTGGVAGSPLRPPPAVTVESTPGTTAAWYNGPVSVKLREGYGPRGATLHGTTTVNAVKGVAAFGDLSIDTAGTGYRMRAGMPNLGPNDCLPFTIIAPLDGDVVRVSVASDGSQGSGASSQPSVSADGRFVAFASQSGNLVPGDTNVMMDVFLRDVTRGTTERVSVAFDGTQGNATSAYPSMSAEGSVVAFASVADNLATGDSNGVWDVFVWGAATRTTTLVSRAIGGGTANASSYDPAVSANGRFVAYTSGGGNIASGDANPAADIFVFDRQTGETSIASLTSDGGSADGFSKLPALSADGRFVAFYSIASNLVPAAGAVGRVYVRDRLLGKTVAAWPTGPPAYEAAPSLSADGRFIAFLVRMPGGTPVLWDTLNGTATILSRDLSGQTAASGSTEVVLDASGTRAAFDSGLSILTPGDANGRTDVFVASAPDWPAFRPSVAQTGAELTGAYGPGMSADGRYVAFVTHDGTVVPGDTNGVDDVFLRGPLTGRYVAYRFTDVSLALLCAAGLAGPDAWAMRSLDANGDGTLNVHDAAAIARKAAGLEPNP